MQSRTVQDRMEYLVLTAYGDTIKITANCYKVDEVTHDVVFYVNDEITDYVRTPFYVCEVNDEGAV